MSQTNVSHTKVWDISFIYVPYKVWNKTYLLMICQRDKANTHKEMDRLIYFWELS